MAVRYKEFQGKPVSVAWHRVLTRAWLNGLRFRVNSGHRTIEEQRRLFQQNMRWNGSAWVPRPGRPLTAWPSCNAPHIRCGRIDHAIDVDTGFGHGAAALATYLNKRGRRLGARFTVVGEPWHIEVHVGPLRDLARRILASLRP